jgi:hypothetical protein
MYDLTVLNSIQQMNSMEHLGLEPSDNEISKAAKQARAGKACGDLGIPAEFWHALESDVSSRDPLPEYILECWRAAAQASWTF